MPIGPLITPWLVRIGLFVAGSAAPAGGRALAAAGARSLAIFGLGSGLGATTGVALSRFGPPSGGQMAPLPTPDAVVVAPGALPQIVKTWQAGAALFAMDNTGQRWVWVIRQNRWKRIRNTRNIVISGKDMRRARKIIAASSRLNDMRARLVRPRRKS